MWWASTGRRPLLLRPLLCLLLWLLRLLLCLLLFLRLLLLLLLWCWWLYAVCLCLHWSVAGVCGCPCDGLAVEGAATSEREPQLACSKSNHRRHNASYCARAWLQIGNSLQPHGLQLTLDQGRTVHLRTTSKRHSLQGLQQSLDTWKLISPGTSLARHRFNSPTQQGLTIKAAHWSTAICTGKGQTWMCARPLCRHVCHGLTTHTATAASGSHYACTI